MNEIKIGTCIPNTEALKWIPGIVEAGFETVSLNFHMSLENTNLSELAKKAREITADKVLIRTLGYYCNPLQYEEHKNTFIQNSI